jgi:quercetin dioxygenase-like cupin family protein
MAGRQGVCFGDRLEASLIRFDGSPGTLARTMRIPTTLPALTLNLPCALDPSAHVTRPGPGVTPERQIDRAEVRVTRVELEPGALRSVDTHDDVRFHLFIPITGKLELTTRSRKPVEAMPGQAQFMQKGTPHGFRNAGSSQAMVMEVLVKDGEATAQQERDRRVGDEDAPSLAETRATVPAHRSNHITTAP